VALGSHYLSTSTGPEATVTNEAEHGRTSSAVSIGARSGLVNFVLWSRDAPCRINFLHGYCKKEKRSSTWGHVYTST